MLTSVLPNPFRAFEWHCSASIDFKGVRRLFLPNTTHGLSVTAFGNVHTERETAATLKALLQSERYRRNRVL